MAPVEFRLRNLPDSGPLRGLKPIWTRELELGAARIGWPERWRPRGDAGPGPWKRGLGCAIGNWGGGPGGSQASVTIARDGRVEVRCGTQDLGTGTTTVVSLVAAEVLGLEPGDVDGQIGVSSFPPSGASGGSTTIGGVSVAVAVASQKALAELFKIVAPDLDATPDDLEASGGRIHRKGDPEKGFTWKGACARMGAGRTISVSADKDEGQGMAASGAAGAQFADVSVDVDTGQVRLNKVVAVADCGLVINRLTCESQVHGGVILGINYALHEERVF